MVTIIPAVLVVHIVDTIEDAAKVSIWVVFINKAMLCPVAHHTDKASIDYRYNKDHERCFETDEAHGNTKSIKRKFTYGKACVDFFSFPSKKIHKRINYTQQQKTKKILQKIKWAVPTIL